MQAGHSYKSAWQNPPLAERHDDFRDFKKKEDKMMSTRPRRHKTVPSHGDHDAGIEEGNKGE
ncbi:hypothetical protein ANO14919_108110 [Xylariales sp. No.14919]|nr:hypothetical protein ANO14919_108110 [Xylariales sp. No.14919]